MATVEKIKRSKFASFLNTTPKGEGETWSRMGKGITSQTISYNPESNTEQYIDEDSSTTTLDRYAPTMDGQQTAYKGEAVFEYVDKLRRARAVGSDAETDLLLVYLYDAASDDATSFPAEKQHVNIQIDDFGGEAGGTLPLNFTVNFMGDPETGTVNITDGNVTFTKDA